MTPNGCLHAKGHAVKGERRPVKPDHSLPHHSPASGGQVWLGDDRREGLDNGGLACRCRHADGECASWVTGVTGEAGADTPLGKLEKGL